MDKDPRVCTALASDDLYEGMEGFVRGGTAELMLVLNLDGMFALWSWRVLLFYD